ncbi:hypothetical protein [Chitinophaga agrisoli]|uniref:hypothetical protein n=1 Tax=Chitinophaga agrisoli TaxID=2607653 RepID=UPI001661F5B7|nr:hypothetical protein [Chitinophaga agrisoli]
MKAYALFIFLLFSIAGYAQSSINNYKYVLVPEKFDFSREVDQYGLNTATKQLLDEKGFAAYIENEELPPAMAANKCSALKAEVVQKKGLFVTNLTLLLKDCQGTVIFKSKEGKSREKEFITAYQFALRDAFTSLNDVPYKYDSTAAVATQQAAPAPAVPAAPAPALVAAPVTPAATPAAATVTEIAGTLYAQPTANGYQLIDTTPKKVLTLFKTSIPDHYIAGDSASNGIVFKRDGAWIFEYYKDDKLVSRQLQIKF